MSLFRTTKQIFISLNLRSVVLAVGERHEVGTCLTLCLYFKTCNWSLISDAFRMAIKVGIILYNEHTPHLENFNWPHLAILFWPQVNLSTRKKSSRNGSCFVAGSSNRYVLVRSFACCFIYFVLFYKLSKMQ